MQEFKFNLNQWRQCVVPPSDPPADAIITLLLDPSLTANLQSDDSGFACGYSFRRESDGINVLTVRDMRMGKYKGVALVNQTLDLIQQWKVQKFSYENIPGMDGFKDLLVLRAKAEKITLPPIDAFAPHNGKSAKNKRIIRLQTLFDCDPPAIRFEGQAFYGTLFAQVEQFSWDGDEKGQENGGLDALSLLAFR